MSIVSTQNWVGSPLLMSSESFICASVLQHLCAIPLFLYMYGTTYPIFIPHSLQKL